MESSSKDIARSQWRSHQRKQAGRGGANKGSQPGRGSGAGKPRRHAGSSELESNNFRYEQDEDNEDLPPGMPVRQSNGGDLEELLKEAAMQATGRFPRRSAFESEEAVAAEFLSAQRAADQSNPLAFDVASLAKSLEALPLHELLGLEMELVPVELRGGTESALQCDLEELIVGNQSDIRLPSPSISDHATRANTSPLSQAGCEKTENTELSRTAAVEEAVQAEASGETVAGPAAATCDPHERIEDPSADGCDAELDALLDAGAAHTPSIPQRGDTETGASEKVQTQSGRANELDALLGLDTAVMTPLPSSTDAVKLEVGHKCAPAVSDGGATMSPVKSKDEGKRLDYVDLDEENQSGDEDEPSQKSENERLNTEALDESKLDKGKNLAFQEEREQASIQEQALRKDRAERNMRRTRSSARRFWPDERTWRKRT
ncbi:hypothetical protein CYMTET_48964 [Cymbomonas tetramitiformis]|uniref:Uncharacterized protein n=1 Tax=Cymbomonas tetramitiformis TaxID=36881 RepID=A0AAE0BST4_9CHLO|nr:hypothetical protein CYMTET_48964 [Cymbomonas tetramitiformis]